MQKPTNEELAAATAANQRHPLKELEADWSGGNTYTGAQYTDLSDVIEEMSIERSLSGDLPDEAGQVEGFISSTMEATVKGVRPGASQHIGRELNRWNSEGVRYGEALVAPNIKAGLGLVDEAGFPHVIRKFTGYVRKLDFDESEGAVDIKAVDPSEILRALITLPTYGEFVNHAHRRPWAFTVNTQWILSYILRKNGIFPSPPFRDDATIACTGHGGLVADIGFNGAPISIYGDGPREELWVEDSNPFGMLGTPEGFNGGTSYYQEFYGAPGIQFDAGWGWGFSQWIHISSSLGLGSSFENRILQVRPTGREYPRLFVSGYGNGDLYMGLTVAEGEVYATPRIPSGADPWKFLGVHWKFTTDTNLQMAVRLNGTTQVFNVAIPDVVVPVAPFDGSYLPMTQMNAQGFRSWMLLQGWPSYIAPTDTEWIEMENADWVPQASLDRGVNEILALPEVSNRDSWEVMKDVVSAEFGVHGFDEFGFYTFRIRSDVRSDVIDVDLDMDTNLLGVEYSEDADSARNVIGYKTTARYHTASLETVVKAEDINEFICGVGTTKFILPWPHGAAGYQSGVLPYKYQEGAETAANDSNFFGKWDGDVVHGWTYSTIGASGGWTILDNTRSVVVRYQQIYARLVEISVTNPGPGSVRLATAANPGEIESGEPAMKIAGWPLTVEYPFIGEVRDQASIDLFRHERSLPLEDNEWRQQNETVQPLAEAILEAVKNGAIILEDLPVIGDARVQAGDVARCWFRDVTEPLIGGVVKVHDEASDNGYDMDVSIRVLPGESEIPEDPLAPPGVLFYIDISHFQGEDGTPLDLPRLEELGYSGCVAKIGQGSSTTEGFGETLDAWWPTWRDQGLALWPDTFAGYWYLGDTETPASQAQRCLDYIGDLNIPVMLDWEAGGGDFDNLVACITAFKNAGLKTTLVYAGRGYANANHEAGVDSLAGRGVSLVSARYWTNEEGVPYDLYVDQPEGFGLEPFLGVTPVANQFTQYGRVYTNPEELIDVNSFLGTEAELSAVFHGDV